MPKTFIKLIAAIVVVLVITRLAMIATDWVGFKNKNVLNPSKTVIHQFWH